MNDETKELIQSLEGQRENITEKEYNSLANIIEVFNDEGESSEELKPLEMIKKLIRNLKW